MADCSAAGTTIDRAARAILGGSSGGGSNSAAVAAATKHVSALLGHAAMLPPASGAAVMPMMMTAPDHLILPGTAITTASNVRPAAAGVAQQQQHPATLHRQSSPAMDQVWNNNSMMMMGPPPPASMTMAPSPQYSPGYYHHHQQQQQYQQQHPMMMMNPMQIQQQQQQQQQHMQFQIMQQQQHHMAMMLQQQQQQQQQSKLEAAHKQAATSQSSQKTRHVERFERKSAQRTMEPILGHDGIVNGASIEQLAAAWSLAEAEYELDDNVTVGNSTVEEGFVRGVGMEELAASWAEAEREYDQVLLDRQVTSDYLDESVDYGNLWQGDALSGIDDQDHLTSPYQFKNAPPEDVTSTAESINFMDEGMQHFQEGNLKDAIRSFEMELQQKDPDNAIAWRMLGKCYAENDQDPEAIKCLEAAVDRDPFSPESLLTLGVSYVNELNHERALESMKAWFTHNPKYAGMELPDISQETDIYGATSSTTTRDSAFNEVKKMLEAAVEFDPTDAGDVQEALGVIYNVIKDYDAAAASFRKALETRPDDHQLWNKLGATLANGSQSDQALPAYHQALQIKPKYARAWLNMAISHSNLQDHDEASRCYLQTLSLNPDATHCWTYLRMALSCKERWDLLPLVFSRDLAGFQQHFDFVLY